MKDMIKEMDTSVKKMLNLKISDTKYPVNMRHYDKSEVKSNR